MSSRWHSPPAQIALSFEVEPNAGNHLAWMNAILGLQRTLMAAERTAVTLIAFGFTVAQVFQNMKSIVPPQFLVLGAHAPRTVGALMIAAGIGSLALFTWQYLRAVAYLASEPFAIISLRIRGPLHQLTCSTAYAIMVLGALGLASILVSF
jgi:putative membrane protein